MRSTYETVRDTSDSRSWSHGRLLLKLTNIKHAIALTWITSIIFSVPFLFLQEWSESRSTCIGPWSLHMNHASKFYVITFSVFSTFVPVAVFCFCYGALIKGLYFTNTICGGTDNRSSEKKKLVVTFIMATTGFVIGYVPTVVFHTALASGVDKEIDSKLYSSISSALFLVFDCSLCLNPILYAFRSSNFQEGFKRIVFCRQSSRPNETVLI